MVLQSLQKTFKGSVEGEKEMIYKVRLSLSLWLFRMGKMVHPEIGLLLKQIRQTQEDMAIFGSGMIKVEHVDPNKILKF